jgi:hypothetical protein
VHISMRPTTLMNFLIIGLKLVTSTKLERFSMKRTCKMMKINILASPLCSRSIEVIVVPLSHGDLAIRLRGIWGRATVRDRFRPSLVAKLEISKAGRIRSSRCQATSKSPKRSTCQIIKSSSRRRIVFRGLLHKRVILRGRRVFQAYQ